MSRPLRPSSERYSVCCSVPDSGSFCSQDGRHLSASSEDDDTPIFSISKSSTDMLASSPRLRDPAFCRLDKPRCSSSSEHCRPQRSPHEPSPLTTHNLQLHRPPSQALSERWLSSVQRWSSCSAQSRSSTPDTVIFRGSPPPSLTQDRPPDTRMVSPPPRTPSPLTSPELTPPDLTPPDLTPPDLTPPIPLSNADMSLPQHDDGGSLSSLQLSPLKAKYLSPLPARELLCFTFPSPVSSTVSLEKFAAEDPLYAVKTSTTEASVDELFTDVLPGSLDSPFGNQGSLLPELAGFPSLWRPTLATSVSDPYLGACCRCGEQNGKHASIRDEGTMTTQLELVDVAVQTFSPVGSWWSLKHSHFGAGSPSILGSPPGSPLQLRSPVGSHFNLVSPSSSMFPVNSDDDSRAERETFSWETASNADVERRSCLKVRGENRELGRRSSMKQVQWDEDGMTWDVHGAAIDPEELNMAIQKHLELRSDEDEQTPRRKSSKKKRAPQPPAELRPPPRPEGRGQEEHEDGQRLGRSGAKEEEEESRRRGPSPGPVQRRKRRSFKRPCWCGGSRKNQD